MLTLAVATILFMPPSLVSIPGFSPNWEAVKARSVETGKPILANFTGSDWCPYCIKLEKEIFTTDEFKAWAKDNVILFEADYPKGKTLPPALEEQNMKLAQEYGVTAYPTVLFMDGKGDVLGSSGYLQDPGPEVWTRYAEEVIAQGQEELKNGDGWPKIVAKDPGGEVDLRGKKLSTKTFGKIINGKPAPKPGRVLIVDLWATWCGPCIAEMPKLSAWAHKYSNYVDIIGVTEESPKEVKEFLEKRQVKYPLYSDESAKIFKEISVTSIPLVLVISPDGIVRYQGNPGDPSDPLTERMLQKIIIASKLRK